MIFMQHDIKWTILMGTVQAAMLGPDSAKPVSLHQAWAAFSRKVAASGLA
jgi:hypothetical protein